MLVFAFYIFSPPYVTSGTKSFKEILDEKGLKDAIYMSNGAGLESLALDWIMYSLKPNGKAFIVVPDGIMNRSNDKKLRDFILENCIIDAVISLPLNTFFMTARLSSTLL